MTVYDMFVLSSKDGPVNDLQMHDRESLQAMIVYDAVASLKNMLSSCPSQKEDIGAMVKALPSPVSASRYILEGTFRSMEVHSAKVMFYSPVLDFLSEANKKFLQSSLVDIVDAEENSLRSRNKRHGEEQEMKEESAVRLLLSRGYRVEKPKGIEHEDRS